MPTESGPTAGSVFDNRKPADLHALLRVAREAAERHHRILLPLVQAETAREDRWFRQTLAERRSEIEEERAVQRREGGYTEFGDEFIDEPVNDEDLLQPEDFEGFRRRELQEHAGELAVAENERRQLRQQQFRIAAVYLVGELMLVPVVERIVLVGAVAAPLPMIQDRRQPFREARAPAFQECHLVELAVWLAEFADLKALQKARLRAVQSMLQTEQIGVAHHQAALALFRAGSDEYRGHLCNFKQCPADKRDCDVPGCGDVSFLQKFANFRFRPESFATDRCVLLFQRHP